MALEPRVLYLFSRGEKQGIPAEPEFARMTPRALEQYVRDLLTRRRLQQLFVWDWQGDGIRMRKVRLEGHRLSWSDPRTWIKKGNGGD